MRSKEEIQKVWDDLHAREDELRLSGCKYKETIDFLHITDKLKKGDKVLEVGVGMGYVTKGFYDAGISISALDISHIALDRVREYCDSTYSLDDIELLPYNYFDFIICHNGIQHIPTYLLEKELYLIILSLKPTGIFALEFISSDVGEDAEWDSDIGCYCRTPEFMNTLIEKHDGYVSEVIQDYRAKITHNINGCFVYHVKRKI
jgi:ubiquinone/menaquinone biosynthesis C-methylase UbiE